MTSERQELAKAFNTSQRYVFYWTELSRRQKEQALARFCLGNATEYAYCIGIDGGVICRRKRKEIEDAEPSA